MKTSLLALLVGLLSFANPVPTAPVLATVADPVSHAVTPREGMTYRIDPAHTTIGFRIRHMGIAFVEGEFDDFEGTITYDPENVAATRADVTVQTTSIDTDVQQRDDHLRSADFFEVETYPTMTFTATGVQPTGQHAFRLVGDLTIKETTKEVILEVEAAGPIPTENGHRVGFHATTTIDRRDFGITWGSELPGGIPAVGNQVQLVLDLEGVTGS